MQCSLVPRIAVHAVVAFERAAPAAGFALVARGERRVVEIIAARALEQVAAGRRQVAKLRRRARQDRLTQHRVTLPDQRVFGHVGVARERAEAHALAVGQFLDLRERQAL